MFKSTKVTEIMSAVFVGGTKTRHLSTEVKDTDALEQRLKTLLRELEELDRQEEEDDRASEVEEFEKELEGQRH